MIYAQILHEITRRKELVHHLKLASALELDNWAIVGGALRDHFWGLNAPQKKYSPKDIDLVYFDRMNCSKEKEKSIELQLNRSSGKKWSVKNQARMHIPNSDEPYCSLLDAVSKFPLQVDTTFISCSSYGEPLLSTIYGYQDLISPAIRPTMHYQKKERRKLLADYIERKNFRKSWPKAKLYGYSSET